MAQAYDAAWPISTVCLFDGENGWVPLVIAQFTSAVLKLGSDRTVTDFDTAEIPLVDAVTVNEVSAADSSGSGDGRLMSSGEKLRHSPFTTGTS